MQRISTSDSQLMESSSQLQSQAQADAARLRDMIMGFRVTQMLYVAAKLNLPDQLADGPHSAERVAARIGADSASLGRFMRALTSLGIPHGDRRLLQ